MKFAIASSLPLLALLPSAALGGVVEKRDADAAPAQIKAAATITVHATFTKTVKHNAVITTRVTTTHTAPTVTVTVNQPGTSTVGTASGFVAANAAITAQAHIRRDAFLHKPTDLPDIKRVITVHGKPKTVTHNIGHTQYVRKVIATKTIHPTTTYYHAKATAYAACGPSNLLGFTFGTGVSGGNSTGNGTSSDRIGINSVVLVSGSVPQTSDTDTAYACCVKCQNTAGCVGSQWRSGVCSTHVRAASVGQCNAKADDYVFGTFYADPGRALNAGAGLILSNGRCGSTWKYGGHKAS